MIKSDDSKSIIHMEYWMKDVLEELLPEIICDSHARNSPGIYQKIAGFISEAKVTDIITADGWSLLSNKAIYTSMAAFFPKTRVELESAGVSYKWVWSNLKSKCLGSQSRELLFLLIHNKLPTKERLYRIQLTNDPHCEICLNSAGSFVCDIEHLFCSCLRVADIWNEIRGKLGRVIHRNVSNFDLLNLNFSVREFNNEIIWVIGSYVYEVWSSFCAKDTAVMDRVKFFGFLKFKFKHDQIGSRVKLKSIQGLFD